MIKQTTDISIDKFVELWNNIENKNWDSVAPKLIENIQETWQSELMTMFNELKSNKYKCSNRLELLFE